MVGVTVNVARSEAEAEQQARGEPVGVEEFFESEEVATEALEELQEEQQEEQQEETPPPAEEAQAEEGEER